MSPDPFREIDWPYESCEPAACPDCGHRDKVDATARCYWDDNRIELRCRKCFHQWMLDTPNWCLTGKTFQGGERVDGRDSRAGRDA